VTIALKAPRPLDRKTLEDVRQKLRPSSDRSGLVLLRERAKNEANTRLYYQGRAPYELLQNADDVGARRAIFILCKDGLAFVHDGAWFTDQNLLSLAEGWSDKDPTQCIGHKGLGFRAVLGMTPSPHLIKLGPNSFALKFSWALNNGHIQETLKADPHLRAEYENWTRFGNMACPIMYIPGLVNNLQTLGQGKDILERLSRDTYGEHYTTLFWFPARDADIDPTVLQSLNPKPLTSDANGIKTLLAFIKDEVQVLLPFLRNIVNVRLFVDSDCIGHISLPSRPTGSGGAEIAVEAEIQGARSKASFFQMRSSFDIDADLCRIAGTPQVVKRMWEEGQKIDIVLSVKLENGQPVHDADARFHVYFPTTEATGFGFLVHSDFYVKPDRTGLVVGNDFNDWLLKLAAESAAGEFLTQLLSRYTPRRAFEAFGPVGQPDRRVVNTGLFYDFVKESLADRETPFVPIRENSSSLSVRDAVVMPPKVDVSGFWAHHFRAVLGQTLPGKLGFLDYEADSEGARAFLQFAAVEQLEPGQIFNFIEQAVTSAHSPQWWLDCYAYMALDSHLGSLPQATFIGKPLIPISDNSVNPVPPEDSVVVCLPPSEQAKAIIVPACFQSVFVFLQKDLAELLENSETRIRDWVSTRLRLTRFEATQLLPRAVSRMAPMIFSGAYKISGQELQEAWWFLKQMVIASPRSIEDPDFWRTIGRFPVPIAPVVDSTGSLANDNLAPAFLTFWPDEYIESSNCLREVPKLRRIDVDFFSHLARKESVNEWIFFLKRAGISDRPKPLRFSRITGTIAFTESTPLDLRGHIPDAETFTGERQVDENRAVLKILEAEELWDGFTTGARCQHRHQSDLLLHTVRVIDGVRQCTQLANAEYQQSIPTWVSRLWSLVRQMPTDWLAEPPDQAWCQGNRGHGENIGSYIRAQLTHYRWLPSSQHGPCNIAEGFMRRPGVSFISVRGVDFALGDRLLPYIVVENNEDYGKLEQLGCEPLEDSRLASPTTLLRALDLIGQGLSGQNGHEIIVQRALWRAVRGAVQDIYRRLNQVPQLPIHPSRLSLATRQGSTIVFQPGPFYYAEPGSATERAFINLLPLLDVDRAYTQLFNWLNVKRLVPGDTITEKLLNGDNAQPARELEKTIIYDLAPYLISVLMAKSERIDQVERDLLLRKLKERFEVRALDQLTVSFTLIEKPEVSATINFSQFYLRTLLTPGTGITQFKAYTLFFAGDETSSIYDVDPDALGEVLVTIFEDSPSAEIAANFSRIATRFCQRRGDRASIDDFLHQQLNVTPELIEEAKALISGSTVTIIANPPALKIIERERDSRERESSNLEAELEKHDKKISEKAQRLLRDLSSKNPPKPPPDRPLITPAQSDRGWKGEEEIKRRLLQPGGWEGFTFVADKRKDGVGYDFLCLFKGEETKLEVKTFTANGRVVLSSGELRRAAESRSRYSLVGLLDDEGPEHYWDTFMIHDPLHTVLTLGEFNLSADLQVIAAKLFNFTEDQA